MSFPKTIIQVALLALLAPVAALAWGEKGHELVTHAATHHVPAEMPRFFHDAYPRLVYLSYDPDRDRGEGRAAWSVDFADHFIDMEYVVGVERPEQRYAFIDAFVKKGVLQRYGISSGDAGFLPYRITELSQQIEQQWWLWKQSDDAARAHIESNIIRLSGLLSHFVGDAANPHHTTIHYNGWVASNPRGYANDCAIHSRFESQFVNRASELGQIVPRVAAGAKLHTDYFAAANALIDESHRLVETLYEIDRVGGFEGRGTPRSRAFAAARMAAASSLLRDLWWSAYRNGLARSA